MPTNVCNAAAGRLTVGRRTKKAKLPAVSLRSIMRRPARNGTWSRSSSTTLPQAVTTSAVDRRQRIRYEFEPVSGTDRPTSKRAKCSTG